MRATVKAMAQPKGRKAVLAVLETKLKEAFRSSLDREALEIEPLADPVDQVCSGVNREMTVKRLNQNARLIQDLRLAVDKVHSEEFGICEHCEEPIGEQRLNAIPWARLCLK